MITNKSYFLVIGIIITIIIISTNVESGELKRKIENKTFVLSNDTWIDVNYKGENTTEILINSTEYFDLNLTKYARVGENFIIGLNGTFYKITTPEPLTLHDYLKIFLSIIIVAVVLVLIVIGIKRYS